MTVLAYDRSTSAAVCSLVCFSKSVF